MERVALYQEYRLIERNENEVSIAWKGAHLILFFLAFVFGSLCTFCFHILMYMFDQKCVLFPKIVKHSSLRHVVYEYFSIKADQNGDAEDSKSPLDFLSTHWVENSVCYLPTYVPLVSGLFGLVWTTMLLMCSSGTSNVTGMQRQWRVLPVIFVFSVAMGAVCIYASSITHKGLNDLCAKLAEVTGSTTCTYTVNVATLAYERRIRGVYQATLLITAAAWLHTGCWLISAAVTALRVLCAVDFQLVCVKAELIGNVERMLEKYEQQIRFVTPESTGTADDTSESSTLSNSATSFKISEETGKANIDLRNEKGTNKKTYFAKRSTIYISQIQEQLSELSLVPEEQFKLARQAALNQVASRHMFIVKMLYDLLEKINLRSIPHSKYKIETSSEIFETTSIRRQKGQENITAGTTPREALNPFEAEKLAIEISQGIREALIRHFDTTTTRDVNNDNIQKTESSFNLCPEMKEIIETKVKQSELGDIDVEPSSSLKAPTKKSNLKTKSTQASGGPHKVQISDAVQSTDILEYKEDENAEDVEDDTEDTNKNNENIEDKDDKDLSDKETQTTKEKQE